LLLTSLIVILLLTGSSLFIIRLTVRREVDAQVRDGINASVKAFTSVFGQRELQLSRTAAMLSELPTLKALMSTQHAPTIQDGSRPFWKLAGSDLLLLGSPDGKVLGLHTNSESWPSGKAEQLLQNSVLSSEASSWWYENNNLYLVFVRPLSAGSGNDEKALGYIGVGYAVDKQVAQQIANAVGSEIALATEKNVIVSTLSPAAESSLSKSLALATGPGGSVELRLDDRNFRIASAQLRDASQEKIRCLVLRPLDQRDEFIARLNRTVLILGIGALFLAALVVDWISRKVTRPLDNLVAGVRAFAAGDYDYAINPRGSVEVVELASSFATMRTRVLQSQRERLEIERIAALGRAANSISHDLRHYLAAVVANTEFLYEGSQLKSDRDEVYQEIKTASEQMIDLIDSLREIAREQGTISPVNARLDAVIKRTVDAIHSNPDFRGCPIDVTTSGDMEGVFDPKKLERVFFNLLLNACQSAPPDFPRVSVKIIGSDESFRVEVGDNGSGIPANLQGTLFEPFVSSGKVNGTGLGLAIVSKIIGDHNGSVEVGSTSPEGTVMVVTIPRSCRAVAPRAVVAQI